MLFVPIQALSDLAAALLRCTLDARTNPASSIAAAATGSRFSIGKLISSGERKFAIRSIIDDIGGKEKETETGICSG